MKALDSLIIQLIKKTEEIAKKENPLTSDDIDSISQLSNIITSLVCLNSGLECTLEDNAVNEFKRFQSFFEKIKQINNIDSERR